MTDKTAVSEEIGLIVCPMALSQLTFFISYPLAEALVLLLKKDGGLVLFFQHSNLGRVGTMTMGGLGQNGVVIVIQCLIDSIRNLTTPPWCSVFNRHAI